MDYKLKDIADLKRGSVITKEQTKEGIIPVVSGGKDLSYYHNESNRDANIITVSGSGAYAGYVNYWSVPIYCSDSFSIKSIDENIFLTKFLYYYLKSKQDYIYSKKKGAGIPHVKISSIEDMVVPNIPIEKQKNILKKIEKYTSCIENRKKQIMDLDLYIQSIYSEMFDSIHNNKNNFIKDKFGKFAKIERGASPRPIKEFITEDSNGINWIKIGDTEENSIYINKTKEKITISGARKSRFVHCGDLILSNSMSFGRPYILNVDGCVHDGWLLIKEYDDYFIKEFLCYMLGTSEVYNSFKNYAVGGVVNNLNSNLVKNIEVIVPPIELQKEFSKKYMKIVELKNILQKNIVDFEKIIDSLIYNINC